MSTSSRDLLYLVPAPDGRVARVPIAYDPATDPYPTPGAGAEIRAYYDREGYVVVRGAVPGAVCDSLRAAFTREVAPSRAFFMRHGSSRPERHVFTEAGYMRYPIMNLQDLPSAKYPDFQRLGLDVLTHPNVQQVISALFDGPGKLMHTMYFEGNQATEAHQDAYYIDSEEFGRMVGVWVALEDIQPGAGRFYVYPHSHLLEIPSKPPSNPNHHAYKQHVIRQISASGLECWAPAMRKGDAIFWTGKTIHGSLPTLTPEYSRSAVTGHYIPVPQEFLCHRTKVLRLPSREVNGVRVHMHYDLNSWRHRMAFWFQGTFPRLAERGEGAYRRLLGLVQPLRMVSKTR